MFNTARLKLTAWYLLIIMLISGTFSFIIYENQTAELDRVVRAQRMRFDRQLVIPLDPFLIDPNLVTEVKERLFVTLLILNGSILVLSGGLSFFLAGRTLRPIAEMMDEQNRFVSDASHELRTPLTSLKSAMEVNFRDKKLTISDAKQLITDSLDQVNKLQLLTDGLLQISRYQSPQALIAREKFLISEIISETFSKVNLMAKKKKIEIISEVSDFKIYGDKDTLTQLLIILLDNAIKYSNNNGKINLNAMRKNNYGIITVEDFGIGIAKGDLEHIFDRFYRSDLARKKSGSGGFGLGLSIAKKIVESHKGTISVKSKINLGTTFLVQLPILHEQ